MSAKAMITMTLILGFVWGGFLLIVLQAVRAEREKTRTGGPSAGVDRGGS